MSESPSPFNIETWRRRNEHRPSVTSCAITPSDTSRVSGERRTHQQAFSDCVGFSGLPVKKSMANEEQDSPPLPLDSILVSRNQIDQALSWARSLKLSKEQMNELDTLSRDPPVIREIKTNARILHLENLLERVITAQPHFRVGMQLNSNIKGLVNRFLCTENILSYKKSADDVIWRELKKSDFGLDPKVFSQRAPVRELKKTINHQLIQQRALLKTKLARSIQNRIRIDRAAKIIIGVLGMESLLVTPALCARYALMRCMLVDMGKDSRNFWDTVDAVLASMKDDYDRTSASINLSLKPYLDRDRELFQNDSDHDSDNHIRSDFNGEETVDFAGEVDGADELGEDTVAEDVHRFDENDVQDFRA